MLSLVRAFIDRLFGVFTRLLQQGECGPASQSTGGEQTSLLGFAIILCFVETLR